MLGIGFIRGLGRTLRLRHSSPHHLDTAGQHILAFWHECVLVTMYSHWRPPTIVLTSRSNDGEIMAAVLAHVGVEAVRGSSSRGGEIALRGVLRHLRSGKNVAVTPDGPIGPYHVAKPGLIYMAQVSGLPIIPLHFTASRFKRLRSWDRHIVPYPFSRALFVYGPPIIVPRDGDVEEWRLRIENVLNDLAQNTERDFDALWKAAPHQPDSGEL
jgi:lysophospholipid acyltransferase (LPLAT)-like uncharacterized protein